MNIYYKQQPLEEAYQQCFGEAIEEYNAKQPRANRKKGDYLTEIKNSGNGEKQFYWKNDQMRIKYFGRLRINLEKIIDFSEIWNIIITDGNIFGRAPANKWRILNSGESLPYKWEILNSEGAIYSSFILSTNILNGALCYRMTNIKIYSVSDRYISYLREHEPNVYSN